MPDIFWFDMMKDGDLISKIITKYPKFPFTLGSLDPREKPSLPVTFLFYLSAKEKKQFKEFLNKITKGDPEKIVAILAYYLREFWPTKRLGLLGKE
jgi:hypothetical protein